MYETVDAHRVVEWCKKTAPASHDALMEVMFRRYFQDGADLTGHEVLLQIVDEVGGLDRQGCLNLLRGRDLTREVEQGVDQAHAMGVTGVPFLVVEPAGGDRKHKPVAFSGAQPPDVIQSALENMARA
mmetsp:Transcript_105605/g.297106  ORF Transcript_105605/g.297106 Transcript_105605/m.297106 type:complete len:128 (-) Transcript_105605:121-504(-)